ncbi:MAG: glycosyltransferase [Planctomycetales bacterium]|nr:glycosyltransferase [Planctomycetales bacterium]
MTIRVLHVLGDLTADDVVRRMLILVRRLGRDEFQHAALAIHGNDRAMSHCLTVLPTTRLHRHRFYHLLWPMQFRQSIKEYRPDVLHWWRAGPVGVVDRLLPWLISHCPTVLFDADLDASNRWDRWQYANCVRAGELHAAEPPRDGNAMVDLRQELGLDQHVRLIGVDEQLDLKGRLKDAIWVADLLKVLHDDVHLIIAGQGALRWQLGRFRYQCHIEDRVHFVGSALGWNSQFVSQLNLWWSLGTRSLPSVALCEALTAGLPVIASDTPAHREVIEDGVNGILVPVGNRANVARQSERLLQDQTIARQIGDDARHRAQSTFAAAGAIDAYGQLYRELARR